MAHSPALLAFYGSATVQATLHKLLKASGGAWSLDALPTAATYTDLESLARREPNEVVIALLAPPSNTKELAKELRAFLQDLPQTPNLVPVVVSDQREMLEFAQSQNQPLVLTLATLTPTRLNDTLLAALELQALRARQTKAQQQLTLADQRFSDMADLMTDWLWELDTNLHLTFSSSRKRPASGATKGSLFTNCFLPEEKLRIEDDFADFMRNPRPFHDRDYWSADSFGNRLCWSVSGLPVVDHVGQLLGFRGVARDVSHIKAAGDQIYYLVNNDPLTGVMNRQRFQDELMRTVRTAKREQRAGALLILDLDRFNYVNQTYGHLAGDKLLIHMAQVLKDTIRTGDVVARLNGDQFALVLRDVRPDDLAMRLERLQGALAARPMPSEHGSITLNVSAGVATYPADAESADALLAHSLSALAKAKERGPRRFERYDPTTAVTEAQTGQLQWVELVNECLTNHQTRMVLFYQPIVPLTGPAVQSKIEHYEVLLRLIDREGQLMVPSKFIATAEEFGLVNRIDQLVTARAIDMLQVWQAQGRHVHLNVNLSGKTFDDPTFLSTTKALLTEAKLTPQSLIFEITETALLRDLQMVQTFIAEMRALGAGFALDDCGVGYSSFSYIRQLDLDYIKIDGSFIRNLHENEDDQVFVKALADIAKQKNISTVAEMVEHEAAMLALQRLGIDFAQGFYFAPPAAELPAEGWNKAFMN